MSIKNTASRQQVQAYLWGLLAITGYSLTLPATKLAVPFFGVTAVGFSRAAITQCQAMPDRRNFELNFIENY